MPDPIIPASPTVTIPPAGPTDQRIETIHATRDVLVMLMLCGLAAALALTGHGELAATALGGALSYAVPGGRARIPRGVAAIALGLIFGAMVGGCAETSAALAVARTGTCMVCAKLRDLGVCEQPCTPPCDAGAPVVASTGGEAPTP